MDPTLMYVVYAVIILVVLILAYYLLFPTTYTLTMSSMTSISNLYTSNDNPTTRTFKSSGAKDGVFYETSPPSGSCQFALLVVAGSATDYSTYMATAQKSANITSSTATPNVTSSTPTYLGVLVSATNNVLDKDVTAKAANTTTWLGIVDLTVLMANFVAAGNLTANIGAYSSTSLPTVNGTTVATSLTGTTVSTWPSMQYSPTTIIPATSQNVGLFSGVFGNGLSIKSNKSFFTIYDSIYYHKGQSVLAMPSTS